MESVNTVLGQERQESTQLRLRGARAAQEVVFHASIVENRSERPVLGLEIQPFLQSAEVVDFSFVTNTTRFRIWKDPDVRGTGFSNLLFA